MWRNRAHQASVSFSHSVETGSMGPHARRVESSLSRIRTSLVARRRGLAAMRQCSSVAFISSLRRPRLSHSLTHSFSISHYRMAMLGLLGRPLLCVCARWYSTWKGPETILNFILIPFVGCVCVCAAALLLLLLLSAAAATADVVAVDLVVAIIIL